MYNESMRTYKDKNLWKENISKAKKGKIPYIASEQTKELFKLSKMGSKNPNWRGGITAEYKRIRESAKYRNWRKQVFERDSYTCQECGDRTGHNLEVHHIKSRKEYPDLVFDLDNGITLCKKCHKMTSTWGNKKVSPPANH